MVSHELLVIANFDGSKTLDEIEFASVPFWVRVANLPMGLMNRSTAQAIGDEVGTFMEMEAEAESDEILVGRFLRVKVRLDIRKPLMRGVTVWGMGRMIDGARSLMNIFVSYATAVASLGIQIKFVTCMMGRTRRRRLGESCVIFCRRGDREVMGAIRGCGGALDRE
jgi:hypothetical protein